MGSFKVTVAPVGFLTSHVHDVIVTGTVLGMVAPPFRKTGSPSATFSFATESAKDPTLKLTKSSSNTAPSVTLILS